MARRLIRLLAVALLVAGCSGHDGGAGSATQATDSGQGGPAGGTTTGTPSAAWGSFAGCPSVGRQIPAGTASAPTVDVDGDGRRDTEWITASPDPEGTDFGVRTASGGLLSATFHSASPVRRAVMFADVTGSGQVIALAGDGRQVLLYAVSECSLVPMTNVQGGQYAFDLGFAGDGTGVGCVDAGGDGARELVGLKLLTDAQGRPTAVQRTVVELHGSQARSGATTVVPVQDEAELARSVTCGPLTMADDGVVSGP